MSGITYRFLIDMDDDGAFSPDEVIAHAVTGADWHTGTSAPHASIATQGEARLMMDGTRLPMTEAQAWLGRRLRINATHGMTTHTLFTGWVRAFEREAGDLVRDEWVLVAVDAWGLLGESPVRASVEAGQMVGAVVAQVLEGIMARPMAMQARWLLGREGHSRLDALRLADGRLPMVLDTGQTRLAHVGLAWGAGVPVTVALRQLADAERGRIVADREGRIAFYDRHHLYRIPISLTISDEAQALGITWGRDSIAYVEVTCQPQRLGADVIALWRADTPLMLAPQTETRLVVPYQDETRQACGAVDVRAPQAGEHYHINTRPDGMGLDCSQTMTSTWHSTLSAGEWRIYNPLDVPVYVLAGATVWGVPLMVGDALTVRHGDDARRALDAGDVLRLDLPAVHDSAFAHDIARYEGARRRPRTLNAQSLVVDVAHVPDALALDAFDGVRLAMTAPDHHADYLVCALSHHMRQGGAYHRLTLTLEPANPAQFWRLGTGHIGTSTYLAL